MKKQVVLGMAILVILSIINISAAQFTCTESFTTEHQKIPFTTTQKESIQKTCRDDCGGSEHEENDGTLVCVADLTHAMKLQKACLAIKGTPNVEYQSATN